MPCTRTGAHIYLHQYGILAYCDAFEINSEPDERGRIINPVAYFRIIAYDYRPINGDVLDNPPLHYIVYEVENWWKDEPVSTLITKAGGFENLGYEGKPVKEALPYHV